MKIIALNRRDFLRSSALVTGGLLLGFESPVAAKVQSTSSQLGPFLQMTNQGKIRLGVPVVEMGQGIYTSLAMSVVEELGMSINDIEHIETVHNPSFKNPLLSFLTNGVFQIQMTGGSTSLVGWGAHYQKIGATAREMIVMAASKRWRVPLHSLITENKQVIYPKNGAKLNFAELVQEATQLNLPDEPQIKSKKNYMVIGEPLKRWETNLKINGTATYGADIQLPGMLYGTIRKTPIIGSQIKTIHDDKAKNYPGFIAAIPLADHVVVVADSTWAAMKSASLIEIETDGGFPELDDSSIIEKLIDDSNNQGVIAGNLVGDTTKGFQDSKKILEYDYYLPTQAHACLETLTSTATVSEDQCEFWGPIQTQDLPGFVAMQALGLSPEKTIVHTTFLGGGFGRKIEGDFILAPIVASKVLGRPVQITWSREEDMRGDFFRPPTLIKMKVGIDADNYPNAFQAKVISPSSTLHLVQSLGFYFPPWIDESGYDFTMLDGMPQQPVAADLENQYAIPNISINYVPSEIPGNWGFWRSIGAGCNTFAIESMVDEVAIASGQDPIELRLRLLGHNSRAREVLTSVRTIAEWDHTDKEHFQGFAYSDYNNCLQAQIVDLSVDSKSNINLHKVTCVIDCGFAHNPHLVKQQIEGAILFGLNATLMGEINFSQGQVVQSNFDDYPMIKLKNTPKIEVHIINGGGKTGRIGETGTPLIGPAVANAVFAATGKRVRRLPIRKEDLA